MARKKLTPKTTLEVWIRSGGRCAYPGCNKLLWSDDLTLRKMNRAYIAHIHAESEGGPRPNLDLTEEERNSPWNLILLCDTHHRLIDREGKDDHDAALLRRYKAEHEEHIEHVTGMQRERRTHLLLFGSRIGDRSGSIQHDEAVTAVRAEGRYPATRNGIPIELKDCPVRPSAPAYWVFVETGVQQVMDRYLRPGEGPTGKPINHLSVFAIAPIPALIYLGRQLGDVGTVEVFQKHRESSGWTWQPFEDEGFAYALTHPETTGPCDGVTVRLSISGRVHPSEVHEALGDGMPDYELTISNPSRTAIRSKEQLELFRHEWRSLLTRIREDHGPSCEVHLFPAVPNSVAVEIGRTVLPKIEPTLHVYDCDHDLGGFHHRLTL